jgi:hypothetical protein
VNSNTQHNRIGKGMLRNVHNSQQSSWAFVTHTCGLIAHGISTRGHKSIKSITENKNHLYSKCTKIHSIEFKSLRDIPVSTPEKSMSLCSRSTNGCLKLHTDPSHSNCSKFDEMKKSTYDSTYNKLYRKSVRFKVGTARQVLVEVSRT